MRDDPSCARALLAEIDALDDDPIVVGLPRTRRSVFPLGDPPDYEPRAVEQRRRHRARAAAATPWDAFYDLLLDDDGRALLNAPLLNYTDCNLDAVREMLVHPTTACGLGDGGAHCGQTCDASTPTFMLTHWARDRAHDRLPLEEWSRR